MEYLESTMKHIWHLDLLEMAWHQPQTNDFKETLTYGVMGEKCNL